MNISEPLKVERGIKKPSVANRKVRTRYPFEKMKVGDSFFVSDYSFRSNVSSAASYFAIRNPEYKFSIARDGEGFRVWRVKSTT